MLHVQLQPYPCTAPTLPGYSSNRTCVQLQPYLCTVPTLTVYRSNPTRVQLQPYLVQRQPYLCTAPTLPVFSSNPTCVRVRVVSGWTGCGRSPAGSGAAPFVSRSTGLTAQPSVSGGAQTLLHPTNHSFSNPPEFTGYKEFIKAKSVVIFKQQM